MVAGVDILFGVGILVGATLCWLGYDSYRRWEQLGVPSLAAFALLLGFSGAVSGVTGLVAGAGGDSIGQPFWAQLALFLWSLSAVPWFLFTLRYTGRYGTIQWRTVGLLYLPFLGFLFNVFWNILGPGTSGVANALSSIVLIYCLGLVILGAFLLVQATRSYVHLSVRQGLSLASGPVVVVLALNSVSNLQATSDLLAVAVYTIALTIAAGTFGITVRRGDFLAWTPAVERIGADAIVAETDDLVFVVDEDDLVIECNAMARTKLDHTGEILGSSLAEVLGDSSADLAAMETVSIATSAGTRRYDPQVSPITDSRDTDLGAVLSLRDVTDRELRQQRLAVLNRVLRHNLRNKIDVIKSHAETLDENEHVHAITDTADAITELGNEARAIDQFVSDSVGTHQVDLVSSIEQRKRERTDDISVTVDLPDAASVETNRRALSAALDSAIDNAFTYADSTVEITLTDHPAGYEISVTNDGERIPQRELDSLSAGTETSLQHSTGLGLWKLKWAVTAMGGELSFETDNATTVRFTVPDLSE